MKSALTESRTFEANLPPSDALRVFTLFGMAGLAGHNNNGQKLTELDSKVISSDVGIKPPGLLPCKKGITAMTAIAENDPLVCGQNACIPPN